jgi:hypothetical protein
VYANLWHACGTREFGFSRDFKVPGLAKLLRCLQLVEYCSRGLDAA